MGNLHVIKAHTPGAQGQKSARPNNMKTILIGLFMAFASTAFADLALTQAENQAKWALRNIKISTNAAQRARYMRDINAYAAILQWYVGQKPAPVKGDPSAAIEQLERLAALQAQAEQKAIDAQSAAVVAGVVQALRRKNGGGDFAEELRMRRLENEVETQRIRAREAAEQQAAAARREAYRRAVGR